MQKNLSETNPKAPPSPLEAWNRHYDALASASPRAESGAWLSRWLEPRAGAPARRPSVPPLRALDLGCGAGGDTARLLALGYEVTALDFSPRAIALSSHRNPAARHLVADLRRLDEHLPVPARPGDRWHLAVAGLSLHYFGRAETEKILAAIHARLLPGGLLAFRVNAYDERGAPPDPTAWDLAIGREDGVPRQYFTADKIHAALAGRFALLSLRKLKITRRDREKSLYEVIALRPGTSRHP